MRTARIPNTRKIIPVVDMPPPLEPGWPVESTGCCSPHLRRSSIELGELEHSAGIAYVV
jgi:hypothetical protein